jgi:thioredoxin
MSTLVIDATDSTFDTLLDEHPRALVDFYMPSCGPCRMMEPKLKAIAAEEEVVLIKIDASENPELAVQYGVRKAPTILVVSAGEVVDTFAGVVPAGKISRAVQATA